MKKIILVAGLFFSLLSFGQTSNDKVVFYDSIGKETFSKKYYFKEIIKEYNLEKEIYEVEYFQKSQNSDIKVSNYFVNDKNRLTPHGKYTFYYPSGSIKTIDNYEDGRILGITKKWYENGNLCFEGEYKFVNEEKLLFHYNYFDSIGSFTQNFKRNNFSTDNNLTIDASLDYKRTTPKNKSELTASASISSNVKNSNEAYKNSNSISFDIASQQKPQNVS